MKSIISLSLVLVGLTAPAFATETRTITGDSAQALYSALVQADLKVKETGSVSKVLAKVLRCSIANGGVYNDGVDRGSCDSIKGTAAAVAIANALVNAGVYEDPGMSHIRPVAKAVTCSADNKEESISYKCVLTAEFSE